MPQNNEPNVKLWEQMALVGRVARAHGNRAEVIVNVETDFPEDRFLSGNVVYADVEGQTRSLQIASVRFHTTRPVLAFEGIDTMDQAESMAGCELRVPDADLMPLPPNSYYHHQLMGCVVHTVAGTILGTVTGIHGSLGFHRLLVCPSDNQDGLQDEIEVPLVESICVRVDPEHGLVVVDPPEGLVELNQRG